MKRNTLIAIGVSVLFIVLTAAYGLLSPLLWNSPDETATAYFSNAFAHLGQLWVFHPYNALLEGAVHPRSISVFNAYWVPGSFYGHLWIIGSAVRLIGVVAYSVTTPILTGIAALALFFLLRRRFGEKIALIGQVLFCIQPALWYYATRGLYPNVIFVDFVVFGLGALILRPWKRIAHGRGNAMLEIVIDDLLGALGIAFAFAIRPAEFIWLAPVLAYLLWHVRKQITVLRVIVFCAAFVLIGAAMGVTNQTLYGAWWRFGYTADSAPGISIPSLSETSRLPAFISAPRPYILPFGFHPKTALMNFLTYGVLFTFWYSVLAAVGIWFFPDKTLRKKLLIITAWIGAVLAIYYGSSRVEDVLHTSWTVGSSYVRYFLPFLLLLVPFAAAGVVASVNLLKKYQRSAFVALLVLTGALSFWTIFLRGPESLIPSRATLERYASIKEYVVGATSPQDLIIVERSDKIFFPDRAVMLNLRDPQTLKAAGQAAHYGNVYYYGITIADNEHAAIERLLNQNKLTFGRLKSWGNESLYAITPR